MEKEKRAELRRRLGDVLPEEFGTDYNLDRWLKNYSHDVDACVPKFEEYLKNRRAFGYDAPTALDCFYSKSEVATHHQIFSLSRLDPEVICFSVS